jgi:tetratricopeptide (TPR) repeat protein
MRLRTIGLVGGAVMLGGAVAAVMLNGHRAEWTTSSPQALAEFELGQDALQKIYRSDARAHFARALQLDPGFVIAKLFLLHSLDVASTDAKAVGLIDELKRADLTKLSPRERFLISYELANHAKDLTAARRILNDYVAKAPDDPFALEILAGQAMGRKDWNAAEQAYAHLMEVDPNHCSAYNNLGYLAMAQGRFAEAEKMFETYRYIASDQANPRDSLGELLTLIGRYDAAEKQFDEALRIKSDFCASYQHLVQLYQLTGRDAKVEETYARMQRVGTCTGPWLQDVGCDMAVWPHALVGDWEGVWQAAQSACHEESPADSWLAFTAAVATGRREQADALLTKLKADLAKTPSAASARQILEGAELHFEGVLLLADGKPAEAADRFLAADQRMTYRELKPGLFKLFNAMYRARALQQSGARAEADRMIASLRDVNPAFVAQCAAMLRVELSP